MIGFQGSQNYLVRGNEVQQMHEKFQGFLLFFCAFAWGGTITTPVPTFLVPMFFFQHSSLAIPFSSYPSSKAPWPFSTIPRVQHSQFEQ